MANFLHESIIQKLYLGRTQLKFDKINEILELLEKNSKLKHLSLQGNVFIDTDYCTLEHYLDLNNHLKVLNLGNWRITAEGIKAIGRGLSQNRTLKSLNLSNNYIWKDSFEVFVESLVDNYSLKALDLSCNSLKESWNSDIQKLIEKTEISNIKLKENFLGDDIAIWAIKFLKELINEQKEFDKEYNSMDPFQEFEEEAPEPPRMFKINLEDNSTKISLLQSLSKLMKSQISPPIPKISNKDLYKLHKKQKVGSSKDDKIENLQVRLLS